MMRGSTVHISDNFCNLSEIKSRNGINKVECIIGDCSERVTLPR